MPDEWMAWAAGIFSGEGFTTGNGARTVRLGISNTNLDMLERFQEIMGCGRIKDKPLLGSLGRKPRWEWICDRRSDALSVLDRMWPWLTDEKRDQASRVIANATTTVFERTCRHCATQFVPTGNGHWYCTTRCRNKARWRREKGVMPHAL